jgi:signal transduction histidine kinase
MRSSLSRTPRSLTRTGIVILLAATLLAAAASVGLLLSRNTVVIADKELEVLMTNAHTLAGGLRYDEETDEWHLNLPQVLSSRFEPAYSRAFFAVRDSSGRAVLSSMDHVPGEVPMVLPNSDLAEPATFRLRRGGMVLRGVSLPVEIAGTRLIIQVADNVAHPDVVTDDLSADFLARVSWVILPVFVALAAVCFGTLHLCMRPIQLLSRRAAGLSGAGERLPEDETPDEIRPLVRAMNAALDRAERAFAAQRHFTAEAAHQMRTPLAVLKAHAELIQDRRTGALLDNDLTALERIVDQLLTLAEIDAAEITPAGPPVDLCALAEAAVDFLDPLAAKQGVELVLDTPPGAVEVEGHEEPLYQAILNLVQNAIGHSPPSGKVWVRVLPPGTVEVADEGPGVPPQQRELVFRRFWRSKGERATRRRGAGLGLAIVQRVAELHRGSVQVEDAPNGGALFRMRLPPMPVPEEGGAAG